MKRLALLLGSLLVVTAAASAKEVVPAPVVVEEAPVQVVEKEVIVYRDKEEGFRPNGFVDLQYRYYGQTEGKENTEWNKNNKYSRIQLQGNINMTENQSLEYRVRAYNSLDENKEEGDTVYRDNTDTRLRYFYNHGLVGDSKVDLTSRLHYQNYADDASQNVEYQARFDFADYMYNNDIVKTDYFVLAPKVGYTWSDDNSSDYSNQVGFDLYTLHTLPWGFSTEFNLYFTQNFYGQDQGFNNGKDVEDKNFTIDMEFYIYNTTNLYANGNFSVDFGFEGGYDPYTWSQEKKFGTKVDATQNYGSDDAKYSLYALPYLQANYAVTDNLTVYAAAGAEYRDWNVNNSHSAKNWRWQPTAWAGFKTTF